MHTGGTPCPTHTPKACSYLCTQALTHVHMLTQALLHVSTCPQHILTHTHAHTCGPHSLGSGPWEALSRTSISLPLCMPWPPVPHTCAPISGYPDLPAATKVSNYLSPAPCRPPPPGWVSALSPCDPTLGWALPEFLWASQLFIGPCSKQEQEPLLGLSRTTSDPNE